MTLLLTNEEVEKALRPTDAIAATESIYRELAEGVAVNRPRAQTYLPTESKQHPGFRYRFKSQEGGSPQCGVWALRVTSDMAGFDYTTDFFLNSFCAGFPWRQRSQPFPYRAFTKFFCFASCFTFLS